MPKLYSCCVTYHAAQTKPNCIRSVPLFSPFSSLPQSARDTAVAANVAHPTAMASQPVSDVTAAPSIVPRTACAGVALVSTAANVVSESLGATTRVAPLPAAASVALPAWSQPAPLQHCSLRSQRRACSQPPPSRHALSPPPSPYPALPQPYKTSTLPQVHSLVLAAPAATAAASSLSGASPAHNQRKRPIALIASSEEEGDPFSSTQPATPVVPQDVGSHVSSGTAVEDPLHAPPRVQKGSRKRRRGTGRARANLTADHPSTDQHHVLRAFYFHSEKFTLF